METPAPNDIVISPSRIDMMRLCPARLSYRHEPGWLGVWGESAVVGIAAHSAIQRILSGMDHRVARRSDAVIADFRATLEADGHRLEDVATSSKVSEAVEKVKKIVGGWYRWWSLKDLTPSHVEVELTERVGELADGTVVWATGILDAVAGGVIYDWKSSTKNWEPGKAQSRAQTLVYPWLARAAGVPFEKMVYAVIDSSGNVVEHGVEITDAILDATTTELLAWAEVSRSENLPHTPWFPTLTWDWNLKKNAFPRGWHCSQYCPAINICKGKFIHPDAVNDKPVVPKWK